MIAWRPGLLSRLADRLVVRLLILMSVALLPLGAIAIGTTSDAIRAAQRGVERTLIGQAVDNVAGKRALIEGALGAASGLRAPVTARLGDTEGCSDYLAGFVARSGVFSFAGFIDPQGVMGCVSSGERLHFGESSTFQALRATPRTTITTSPAGATTGLPVVIVSVPVFEPAGTEQELLGFISLSIARSSFEILTRRLDETAPAFALLFNSDGDPLTLNPMGDGLDYLPASRSLAVLAARGDSGMVFRDRTVGGQAAVYAVAELIPDRLFGLGMWPETSPLVQPLKPVRLPLIFPALMWLASLGVVLLALYYLVLRHLRRLNSQMRRFALGQREDWPDLEPGAPAEFRDLNATFAKMARIIGRDEAEQAAALAEKTVLLKEVHHRVKNNLQLIASIINLHLRQLHDPAARQVLCNVQDRVLGLADTHRALYQEKRLSRVRADQLLDETLQRMVALAAAPGRRIALTRSLEPVSLPADRMVPLSFLLTEAVTNALKHQNHDQNGEHWIDVTMNRTETDEICLAVINSLDGPSDRADQDDDNGPSLGQELIEAFATQLDARLVSGPETDPARGAAWRLEVCFDPGDGQTAPSRAPVDAR